MRNNRWVGLVIALAIVVIGTVIILRQMSESGSSLKLHDRTYNVVIRRTEAELEKGLSGTDSLPEGHAMLFDFGSDDLWGIWMKDMKYPIDIVWLSSGGEVVYDVKDVQPSSYPATIYKPDRLSRYVIELPSGTIERTGIRVGDKAVLPSNS